MCKSKLWARCATINILSSGQEDIISQLSLCACVCGITLFLLLGGIQGWLHYRCVSFIPVWGSTTAIAVGQSFDCTETESSERLEGKQTGAQTEKYMEHFAAWENISYILLERDLILAGILYFWLYFFSFWLQQSFPTEDSLDGSLFIFGALKTVKLVELVSFAICCLYPFTNEIFATSVGLTALLRVWRQS